MLHHGRVAIHRGGLDGDGVQGVGGRRAAVAQGVGGGDAILDAGRVHEQRRDADPPIVAAHRCKLQRAEGAHAAARPKLHDDLIDAGRIADLRDDRIGLAARGHGRRHVQDRRARLIGGVDRHAERVLGGQPAGVAQRVGGRQVVLDAGHVERPDLGRVGVADQGQRDLHVVRVARAPPEDEGAGDAARIGDLGLDGQALAVEQRAFGA